MANDYIPRPDARLHAWRNNLVTYANGHLADLGLAAGAMVAEIWGWGDAAPATPPPPGWAPQKTQGREEERKNIGGCSPFTQSVAATKHGSADIIVGAFVGNAREHWPRACS